MRSASALIGATAAILSVLTLGTGARATTQATSEWGGISATGTGASLDAVCYIYNVTGSGDYTNTGTAKVGSSTCWAFTTGPHSSSYSGSDEYKVTNNSSGVVTNIHVLGSFDVNGTDDGPTYPSQATSSMSVDAVHLTGDSETPPPPPHVYNVAGTIDYWVTSLAPGASVSGSGTISGACQE